MPNKLLDKIITGIFVGIFATMWFFSSRYYERPKQYSIIVYDVFGKQVNIEGLRTNFHTSEVTASYIKEYQKRFSHYNFSVEQPIPEIKKRRVFNVILRRK
ncbi:MAG: hypothetical protein R3230_02965 [Nitrosopumilaceae archaeon]|nr:hypothetical protein [Nitrosopumilaceae archaeon]